MTALLTLPAPAKLNLFLHITGRRADGYHTLQTLFALLDYGDTLHFTVVDSPDIRVEPALPGVPSEQNLVYRAARLLQSATQCGQGAEIRLEKRLPMGGGIGGGSSDAATTLLALNHLWQTGLTEDALAALGLQLGADVPVFVRGRSAWAEGVGEIIFPAEIAENWYLVLKPACEISTRDIFSNPALTRNTSPIKLAASQTQYCKNDCESVVRQQYREVDEALEWLDNFGKGRLTGTGSCVFLECESRENAEMLLQQSPFKGFVAKAVNESPVHRILREALKN
ncbi:MAG: 4-(cytidine 5'-diphospho)-2-C-methyl-D-erythritol kinase [Fluviicoccus sp.]|nr:4-(cytidine 5'-diphospho)-2-C-methyl-D-erythritol kinase [Fluviicoccus sp.]MDO8330430.1 4-(cytidine 5'-diphospho)-2-C-methyl-D-erythritol kinase [Fluviicoccus sp.]